MSLVKYPSSLFAIMDSADVANYNKGYYWVRAAKPGDTAYVGVPNIIRHHLNVNINFMDGHVDSRIARSGTPFTDPYQSDNTIGSRAATSKCLKNWTYDGLPR